MIISESRTINAPRERAFAIFSDIPNAPSRIPEITKVEMLTEGPVGVGTKWRETRVVFGKEHAETMEITEFRAPEFYAAGANSCGSVYRATFEFRSISPESTEVTFTFGAQPQTIMARIMSAVMGPMMKGMMRKCLAADLASLARASEAKA